jgi:diguanylate cyclase (GGDEF)-like protein
MEEHKKIIAVDDNLENLTVLKDTLKDIYEVYTSPSALKMFDLLEHFQPDLILLDVEMPVMNGYEAIKKLKSDERYRQIPVIFLTVRDDVQSEMEGLKLGAIDYIRKPFATTILIQRIKTHLSLVDYQKIEIITMATVIAMEHIKEGFVLLDADNNYLSSNPAAIKMLPGITKIAKGEPISYVTDWPNELKNNISDSVEFSITTGISARYYKASISPVFLKDKSFIGRIFLFSDITDNVNFVKKLENAAYIDSLTGIYNRKHFIELANADIKRAVRMDKVIYTAMIDIDFFKVINDTFGHATGDIVLRKTADIIHQTIRSYDLLGRYGGDEFIIMFSDIDNTEAYKMVERIRKNIENSVIDHDNNEIKLTISIGLAKFNKTDTLETAIKNADESLYTAKNSGRNLTKVYDN